jgi:hypothetical protein
MEIGGKGTVETLRVLLRAGRRKMWQTKRPHATRVLLRAGRKMWQTKRPHATSPNEVTLKK